MNEDLPIHFDRDGLVPVVVQDVDSGDVLMMAFMNADALEATRRSGRSHFWSRSRGKLWRKGETSGHEQIVDEILINCEQNSLLLKVHQIGAVCHEGYTTCFYRTLEPDNLLTIQRERVFDPASVYGTEPSPEMMTKAWLGAYGFLGERDLSDLSNTSKLLHDPYFDPQPRITDEIRELAGILDGSHSHGTPSDDVLLEGTQVLYWIALTAIKTGLSWNDLRPDRALETATPDIAGSLIAEMLRLKAEAWAGFTGTSAASLHEAIALVSQAARSMDIEPMDLVRADLAELRSKPYLSDYFDSAPANTRRS